MAMTVGTGRAGHASLFAVTLAVGLVGACGSDPVMQRDGVNGVAGSNGGGANGGAGGQGGMGTSDYNPKPGEGLAGLGGFGGMEMECAGVRINASRILPTVMLVVDGSASMEGPYGDPPAADPDAGMPMMPPAGPSRWASVREALVGPDGVVGKLQDRVNFGLAVYGTNATCPLPLGVVAPQLNNAAAITSGIPQTPPGLFTPTGVALEEVVKMLPDPTMVLDGPPIGPQIILLATDGDPNACDAVLDIFTGTVMTDYGPSISAAMMGQAKNLRMYVVSVGQDAAASHLQQMANIGAGQDAMTGTAEVHYPENTATLTATLETLIGAELSCDLALEGKGIKVDLACTGTVTVNGTPLECNGPDGFQLVDEKTLRLNGTTCEMYKNSVDTLIDANFPCDAVIIE
jgi:hypothetical protein